MTICMTNSGLYTDVSSINGQDTSCINNGVLAEILDNTKFIHIVFNDGLEAILRTSCISSINCF